MADLPRISAAHAFLFAAILVYALAGTPTPDNPGMIEGIIGALLLLSVLCGGIARIADVGLGSGIYIKSVQIFFLCGLIVPTAAAVYFANGHALILRDIAAFCFLGLPLFLAGTFAGRAQESNILIGLCVLAGIGFCVRTLMPVFNVWAPEGELLYLSNSPLAMFAGIALVCAGWSRLLTLRIKNALPAALCFGGAGVIVAAMLLDVQRATIGAIVLSLIGVAVTDLVRTPKKAAVPFAAVVLLLLAVYPLVGGGVEAMVRKTGEVGLNMRLQEAGAVYDAMKASPVSFFAGQGWGAVFSSPAVGGLEVNYTHSLLTTMAMKGGAAMFMLCLLMLVSAVYEIFLIFQRDKSGGFALLWPLLIPAFLYASHKSLDFGLVLLLIGMWRNGRAPLQPR